jgi:hypothetical protein
MATSLGFHPTKGVRRLGLGRNVAITLAATEYDRVIALLEGLHANDWALPTECPAWDVRSMAGRLLA